MKTRGLFDFNCLQPTFYMKYIYVVLFLFFTLALAPGCTKTELPIAFEGGFDVKKIIKLLVSIVPVAISIKNFLLRVTFKIFV